MERASDQFPDTPEGQEAKNAAFWTAGEIQKRSIMWVEHVKDNDCAGYITCRCKVCKTEGVDPPDVPKHAPFYIGGIHKVLTALSDSCDL